MELCDSIFEVVRPCLEVPIADACPLTEASGAESSSVLLLGEAGSGKTHAVEWCINRLREADSDLVVLRARGMFYATDVECVRHLATQVSGELVTAPRANASFDQGMEWFREVLKERFDHTSAVVIVLDRFECFCSRPRQTLLYNLFDIAQEVGVRLSIIGMSERIDVMSMLEKRIRSRFSMRHLHTFLPTETDSLIKVLLSKLRLPSDCGLKPVFLKEFNKHLEAALRAKSPQWQHYLDLGKPPSWFLWQCLPLAATLGEAAAAASKTPAGAAASQAAQPAKRPRLATSEAASKYLPATITEDTQVLLLGSISEADHVVLLAFWKIKNRQETPTLARVLHDVQLLHEGGGFVAAFVQDRYCAAFERLLRMRLVGIGANSAAGMQHAHASTGGDVVKRYQACFSTVNAIYEALVVDLEKTVAGQAVQPWNPLRSLPQPIQQWAGRTRRG